MNLHQLVSAAARRTPQAPAIVTADATLTYGQLDEAADRYAAALRGQGVRPGDRVVVWIGKSVDAVALMQGVLRVGAAYVPVTESNPPARLRRIATNCTAAVVVADEARAAWARGEDGEDLPLVTFDELRARPAERLAAVDSDPDALAYILYTSGSTGEPKGVCLSHRNALAFVDWAVRLLDLRAGDRLSNHAPFNFDLSVFDLYGAFHAGASVHLVPAELAYAPAQLVAFIREQRISVWYSVPSVLSLMMREGLLDGAVPPDLRAVVFAGEPFAIAQVQRLRKSWPGVRLFNWYGPTETNVCTSYEVTDKDLAYERPLPIGTAASGDEVWLDPGDPEGEIVVSGPTVMLGYWGRPPHEGPYRTGDIGQRGSDWVLDYVGRIDHMVKIRGNRIELGEVETALAAHPSVSDVVVLVVGTGLDARLHAVVTPVERDTPTLLDVKRWCAERLPTYMIVDALHVVDALPLTANGKTDRMWLRAAIEENRI